MSYYHETDNVVTAALIYFFFYLTFCIFFIFPTKEVVAVGITVEGIFGPVLRTEHENFILYHMTRTSLTLLIHSALPLGFILSVLLFNESEMENLFALYGPWVPCLFICMSIPPVLIALMLANWSKNGTWDNHPIAHTLQKFCDPHTTWQQLAADISFEYRSIHKVNLQTSTIYRVIATDNWIMKVSPYKLDITHQSDSVLILRQADTHEVSIDGQGAVQYVSIEVKTTRPGIDSFFIRCNSSDFQLLQNKVTRPISIMEGIVFHKSLIEQFLEVFEDTVQKNPPYLISSEEPLDACIGCMVADPAVKLVKCCPTDEPCTTCYCRPLWCLSCMGRWFASRQDQDQQETWLSSTCTCPLCRSVFCMLDVCPVVRQ